MKKKQNKAQNKARKGYVLVTGASSGIGEATALLLAENNYPLVLTARRLDRLKALAKKCLQKGAPDVHCVLLDVTDKKSIQSLKANLRAEKIEIQILINNAGLAKGVGLFQDSDLADAEDMLETNVKGLLAVTHALLPQIIKQTGHIVNLGSVAGRLVYEGGTVYCATKFAVRAISDALRFDLKGTGVRVTNIEPGMVQTDFSVVRLGNQQKADAVYADMMPLLAMDIAKTILWCVAQPPHVNISELVIYPTDQASVGHVVRGEKSIAKLLKK